MRVVMLKSRAGFTLVEMLVALTLTAVLGATITGAFVSQSRFFDKQDKVGAARGVARAGTSMLLSDLRMVESDSGVVAASNTSITVHVPYAFGLACTDNLGVLRVSRLPVDSLVIAMAAYSGYAYRTTDSTYTYPITGSLSSGGSPGQCQTGTPSVREISGGRVIQISSAPAIAPGTPIFLYQTITYSFKPSASVSGRIGLFRERVDASSAPYEEEIAAPFGPNAGFRFYIDHSGASQAAVPVPLNDITGFEIVLDGLSERPNTDGTYETVSHTTSVFLKN